MTEGMRETLGTPDERIFLRIDNDCQIVKQQMFFTSLVNQNFVALRAPRPSARASQCQSHPLMLITAPHVSHKPSCQDASHNPSCQSQPPCQSKSILLVPIHHVSHSPPVTIPNASHKFKCDTRKTKISVTHGTGYTLTTLKPSNLLYKDSFFATEY